MKADSMIKLVRNGGFSMYFIILKRKIINIILLIILFIVLLSQYAQAYLDPGAGSYITQYIIAILIGIFYFLKCYWKKIKRWIVNLFSIKN